MDGEGRVSKNLARRVKFSMILSWLLLSWAISPWSAITAVSAFAVDAKPGWQTEWERTLGAAEKEGEVAVAIYDQGPVTVAVVDAFQKTFPKIKVNSLRARGSQIGPKIIAERRAEKYLIDLFTGGKGTALSTLHAGKALEPIKPLLILPEVVDPSKWWNAKLRYVDPEGAYVLAFVGNGGGVEVTFNTKLGQSKRIKILLGSRQSQMERKNRRHRSACGRARPAGAVFLPQPGIGTGFHAQALRRNGYRDQPGLPSTDRLVVGRQIRVLHPVQFP